MGKDLDIYVSCMYRCSKNVAETSKCSKRAPIEQLKISSLQLRQDLNELRRTKKLSLRLREVVGVPPETTEEFQTI